MAGVLAAGCGVAQRVAVDWKDVSWLVLISTICAHVGAVGSSASLPRGPLPSVSRLVLVGAAKSRAGAGRVVLAKVVADSVLAAGVFTTVVLALGLDFRLIEMVLLAFAACHIYLILACGSRWLLSSRRSALVAAPAVVAIAGAAWFVGPWGLPLATVACIVTGVAAIYLGGVGIGRLDVDLAAMPQPSARA